MKVLLLLLPLLAVLSGCAAVSTVAARITGPSGTPPHLATPSAGEPAPVAPGPAAVAPPEPVVPEAQADHQRGTAQSAGASMVAQPAPRRLEPPGPASPSPPAPESDYRVGVDDELEISVYGDTELGKVQTVRPGGKISVPLVGDVHAAGLTPDELRSAITDGIGRYVKDPKVTVIVTKYNSRRVSVLGELKSPGLLRLSSDIRLLEGIARAGGITEDADLKGALLIRGGQLVPVDFERLLKQGDVSQDIVLQPNDSVLIPNIRDKKVFVLGQVTKPLVVALQPRTTLVEAVSRAGGLTDDADLQGAVLLRQGQIQPVSFDRLFRGGDGTQNILLQPDDIVLIPSIRDRKAFVLGEVTRPAVFPLRSGASLVEAISLAGGFTREAQPKSVLLIRGGLADPQLITVNVNDIVRNAQLAQNFSLQPNDIIYVPKSFIANVTTFFQTITTILTPIILAESGIVLGPAMHSVLTRGKIEQSQPVIVAPR